MAKKKTKRFKLIERVGEYQACIIEAADRDEAMRLYKKDEDAQGNPFEFNHESFEEGCAALIAIDELDENGVTHVTHDVQDGKFVDNGWTSKSGAALTRRLGKTEASHG